MRMLNIFRAGPFHIIYVVNKKNETKSSDICFFVTQVITVVIYYPSYNINNIRNNFKAQELTLESLRTFHPVGPEYATSPRTISSSPTVSSSA